jgi:hypothetical protein
LRLYVRASSSSEQVDGARDYASDEQQEQEETTGEGELHFPRAILVGREQGTLGEVGRRCRSRHLIVPSVVRESAGECVQEYVPVSVHRLNAWQRELSVVRKTHAG